MHGMTRRPSASATRTQYEWVLPRCQGCSRTGKRKVPSSSLWPALSRRAELSSIWSLSKVSTSCSGDHTKRWSDQMSPMRSSVAVPTETQHLAWLATAAVEPGSTRMPGSARILGSVILDRCTRTDGWVWRSMRSGKSISPNQSIRQKSAPRGNALIKRPRAFPAEVIRRR
ncbi:hypothetical protein GALL_305410 [mine drainage metagenome]|uniref:Uncharacterized protein n=1 Tax=mine drainage metagenome TaxID=410659 RepID=A0A1J5R6E4_9ZZZZ